MADRKTQSDSEWEEIKAVLRVVGERLDAVGEQLREIALRQKESERRQAKIDQQQAKTDKMLRELGKQLGGQSNRWGKIIESLVEGDLCALMTKFFGIDIVDVSRRVEVKDVEIDLVAVNTDTVVVVEVKTTLAREHIDKFISSKLSRFTELRPHYKDSKVYGVIAFVKVDSNAKETIDYAISQGLIVIKAMRGTNHILNPKGSRPRDFHP